MVRFSKLALIGLASVAALGCGDDGGGSDIDASTNDAPPPDAALPDALQATCTPAAGTDIAVEVAAAGLVRPVFLTSPPGDPRLFIIEQPGRIRIVDNGELLPDPFLDIGVNVRDTGNEQGLLGLAFHRDYAQNGRFFVNYTANSPAGATVVAEYAVSSDPNAADPTSERRLLTIDQPFSNHNGGMIEFGPDNFLYIGMGDGGSGGDPQENGEDPTTLLGSILRIDVDGGDPYGIPSDNPFADSPGGPTDPRPEIWSFGWRNPWRFSFDRANGDLYVGDVGQGEIEEIDVEPAGTAGGLDYGWNTMEGSQCFDPAAGCDKTGRVLPVTEYSHNRPGGGADPCSVTGGYVYRGSCLPDLQGTYIYADFCSDQVFAFELAGGVATNEREIMGLGVTTIASFGEDATGEMYILTLGGTVFRVIAPGG